MDKWWLDSPEKLEACENCQSTIHPGDVAYTNGAEWRDELCYLVAQDKAEQDARGER